MITYFIGVVVLIALALYFGTHPKKEVRRVFFGDTESPNPRFSNADDEFWGTLVICILLWPVALILAVVVLPPVGLFFLLSWVVKVLEELRMK